MYYCLYIENILYTSSCKIWVILALEQTLEELNRSREQNFVLPRILLGKEEGLLKFIEGKIKNHFLARHYLEIVIAKAITEDERHKTPV